MKLRTLGALAVALTGCNNPDIGLVPLFVEAGQLDTTNGGCTFESTETSKQLLGIQLDVAVQQRLGLIVIARNDLSPGVTTVDRLPGEDFPSVNSLRPVRFDYSWECDSHEFLTGLPPIVVPAHFNQPFCYDNQEDTDEFVGTEVISVTGPALAPGGGTGGIQTRAVSVQTAEQLNETFTLARSAEDCCKEDPTGGGGCYNREGAFDVNQSTNTAACTTLNNQLLSLSFGRLSTAEATGVETFRPFVQYTGPGAPVYPMRLRGVFEAITADGSSLNSPDFSVDIGFCAGDASGTCFTSQCTDF
jgi:hypothetical protein